MNYIAVDQETYDKVKAALIAQSYEEHVIEDPENAFPHCLDMSHCVITPESDWKPKRKTKVKK